MRTNAVTAAYRQFGLKTMGKLKRTYLLSKLKAGKKEYFDEFYESTKGAVWYVVRKYIRQSFHAEDVMQDVYVAFLNNLQNVVGDPLPYLCGMAKNRSLDSIKKESKTDKNRLPEDLPFSVTDEYETDNVLLRTCKKRLGEEEYFILEHTVVFGYTRVAVAEMLGKPVSTINRKYNDVLKKVKIMAKEVYR